MTMDEKIKRINELYHKSQAEGLNEEELAEQKMQADIKCYIPYILQKIQDCGLGMHSFYIYVLPCNDSEEEKKSIMEAVLEGDVDLI